MNAHFKNAGHIEFGLFPGYKIVAVTILTGHFVGQRNAFGLGCDDVIVFRSPLQQGFGTGYRQGCVAKNDKGPDGQVFIHRTDGELTLQAGDGHGVIMHGDDAPFH